jgi:hypothetical protein
MLTKALGKGKWLALVALAAGLCLVLVGCDEGPDFGSGLDDGKNGACTEYPSDNYAWAMDTVVPPTHFNGEPGDLDLDSIWCQKAAVKSLIFILGYPT